MIYSTLVEEPFSPSHSSFLKENGIKHYRIPFIANKDASVKTPDGVVNTILRIMLDKANHPMLIHCNKGKVSPKAFISDVSMANSMIISIVLGA